MLLAQGDLWDSGSDALGYFLLAEQTRHSVIDLIGTAEEKQPLYIQERLRNVPSSDPMFKAWSISNYCSLAQI